MKCSTPLPVSCLLTSASLHDSQAAIPLAKLTAGRVQNLYDLMDSAYDAEEIRACSRQLGHVPLIDQLRPHWRRLALNGIVNGNDVATFRIITVLRTRRSLF